MHPAPATQGVGDIKHAKTSLELCQMMHRDDEDKNQSYNALPAKTFLEAKDREEHGLEAGEGGLPTIQFRQHEGTLDPKRVRNWVSLLMGIVEFCRDIDSYSFDYLLIRATSLEQWEKRGDETDAENGALYGRISTADGGEWSIIDLLD